jgi:hypothetical protein
VKNPLKEFRRLKNGGEYQVYGQKKTRKIMDLEKPNPCFKIPLYEIELFI